MGTPEATNDLAPTSQGQTLGEYVYEWVRDRIIDGTLPTGTRIRERDVAEEIQVSRVPVREALPRLEAEGFIRTLPRRGAVVAPMELCDVIEVFDVRAALEVLAARLAAERCAAGADGSMLSDALAAAEAAIATGNGQAIARATSDFHGAVVQLANSSLLTDLMVPVQGRVNRLFNIANDRDAIDLHREHYDLCDAVLRGQVQRASALALAHVEHSRADTVPIFERAARAVSGE
ncbi:GntR family transcriptional regulator [Leucobacter salsicius]|uniref:GntR family transcriptional regulator n=1 Tax=Leucobacter salsicius TaxID=664638 RepID=UPI0003471451|nr:GntR family transcriptional regulator [Leucobacter salsicius]